MRTRSLALRTHLFRMRTRARARAVTLLLRRSRRRERNPQNRIQKSWRAGGTMSLSNAEP